MDFPVTRRLHDQMEIWVQTFAGLLPPAQQIPVQGSFRWEHTEHSARTVQVAKAVRAVSGLRAALALADRNFTTESATLLRVVADFAAEIIFLGEALLEDRVTDDQQKFITQHYAPLPTDPDQLAAREKEYYVGRKAIAAAHQRIFEKTGSPGEKLQRISAYLNKGYDAYVHGANVTAMELYDARTNSFMLSGQRFPRFACVSKVSVSAKTNELLNSLHFMAIVWKIESLVAAIVDARAEFDAGHEDDGSLCVGLA